jgi:hypothetical protein
MIDLDATEMTADNITVICSDAAGAQWGDVVINIQTSARQVDDLAFPNTSGRGMDVDASGGVEVGSFQTGALGAAAFAAGAIDAAAIAADAIGSSELAATAATEIADALLARNVAGGSSTGRTVTQALYALRNRTVISAGTLTVYQTDDTTAEWTAAVTTSAGDPISEINPT